MLSTLALGALVGAVALGVVVNVLGVPLVAQVEAGGGRDARPALLQPRTRQDARLDADVLRAADQP